MHLHRTLAALAPLLIAAPSLAQELFVDTNRTLAGGNPIVGLYDAVSVGIDPDFVPAAGVLADLVGTTVNGSLATYGDSRTRLLSGATVASVEVYDNSSIEIVGASMGSLTANNDLGFGKGRVWFRSGDVSGDIAGAGLSQVNVLGGAVAGRMIAMDLSRFTFRGLAFSATPNGSFVLGRLSGSRWDLVLTSAVGTFRYDFYDVDAGSPGLFDPGTQFEFRSSAPEPGSLALAAVGLSGWCLRRRRGGRLRG